MKLTRLLCLAALCGFLAAPLTAEDTKKETKDKPAAKKDEAKKEDKKKDGDKKEEKPKLRQVKVKDVVFKIPEGWKEEEPKSKLRAAQFAIPNAKGDKGKTELAVFVMPGGGSFAQNLPRWTREFKAATLKVKAHKGECPQGEYTITELTGTHVGSSFAPRAEPIENGAMVTLILVKEGRAPYYLKMSGPAKTIKEAATALRRALDADAKKEKPVEL